MDQERDMKGSTYSIETTASARGQEVEKKSFIKEINTLQALVDGNKVISVTVTPPKNIKSKAYSSRNRFEDFHGYCYCCKKTSSR